MSVSRPRKKAVITTYGDLYKTKIKKEFDQRWNLTTREDSTVPHQRLHAWNEQVRTCWENETPEVRDEVIKQTDEENEELLGAWKKRALSSGAPEDLHQ